MNSLKVLGANMIAFGFISLMFGIVGLKVGVLSLLDEFGPIIGCVLKVGFMVAGIWVWRKDTVTTDEEVEFEPEDKRAWIPVAICGTVVVGVIGYVAVNILKDHSLGNQMRKSTMPAAWAASPDTEWPAIVLMQKATFKHHSSMEAGCVSLIRLPTGEIVALTAGHLLGNAGGVRPGFTRGIGMDQTKLATLTAEIALWKLFTPDAEDQGARVTGLHGQAVQFDEHCDQLLLSVSCSNSVYPVIPLDVRLEPLKADEPLNVVTFAYDAKGNFHQVVYHAKWMNGSTLMCKLDRPAELSGSSGAPVVDKNGLLVGIVTGKTLMEMSNPTDYVRTFVGRPISDLLPVIKAAVSEKGIGKRVPVNTVVHPKKNKSDDHENSVRLLGNSA